MIKIKHRFILVLLCLIIFIVTNFADFVNIHDETMTEIPSKRTSNSKFFTAKGDISKTLLFTEPVHYENISGQLCEINTQIVPISSFKNYSLSNSYDIDMLSKYAYFNSTNSMKNYFPDFNGEILSMDKDANAIKHWIDPEIQFIDRSGEILQFFKPDTCKIKIQKNNAIYECYEFAKVKFEIIPGGIKQEIIVDSLPSELGETEFLVISEFLSIPESFYLSPAKPEAYGQNDFFYGEIQILNQNGEPVYTIPKPEIYELNRPQEKLPNTHLFAGYKFEIKDSLIRLDIYIPYEWVADDSRIFPIVIDPSISCYANFWNSTGYIESTTIFGMPYDVYHGSGGTMNARIYAGSVNIGSSSVYERGWAEFNISSIDDGLSSVENVELYVNCANPASYTPGLTPFYLNLYEMDIQPSIWESNPSYVFGQIGIATTYVSIYPLSTSGWHVFDLGSSADSDLYSAISSGIDWFSVGFTESFESATGYEAFFYGSLDGSSLQPYLSVTYNTGCTPGLWTGAINSDWNNGGNWDDGHVPTTTTNVTIPNASMTPHDPEFSIDAECCDIDILSGGVVQGGSGILTINGNWMNNGEFYGGNSKVVFAGSVDQAITGSGMTNFFDLENSKSDGEIYLSKDIGIEGVLDMIYPGPVHLLDMGTRKIDLTP